jgi:hypothetical protein
MERPESCESEQTEIYEKGQKGQEEEYLQWNQN